jgi:hypothetical protein
MKYLFRDSSTDYHEVTGEPLDSYKQPYRPWAVTSDGRVVYSEWKTTLAPPGGAGLKPYNKAESIFRRREFETLLAHGAGNRPECVKPALDVVSNNLVDYVAKDIDRAGKRIQERCYGNTMSGRLGVKDACPSSTAEAWRIAVQTLRGTDVPKILGIQSCLGNVYTRDAPLTGGKDKIYKDTTNKVAPKSGYLYNWFSSNDTRGRKEHAGAQSTTAIGLVSPGLVTDSGSSSYESRIRGIDMWDRSDVASPFLKGIDMRNITFGAGRSGTTGELLKVYRTFGSLDTGEEFKQYLLAIVIYLVTGGHHSCHEIFSVANLLTGSDGPKGTTTGHTAAELARGAYVPGKYIKHLPNSYLTSDHWEKMKEKYFDIALLGHLHGTFV